MLFPHCCRLKCLYPKCLCSLEVFILPQAWDVVNWAGFFFEVDTLRPISRPFSLILSNELLFIYYSTGNTGSIPICFEMNAYFPKSWIRSWGLTGTACYSVVSKAMWELPQALQDCLSVFIFQIKALRWRGLLYNYRQLHSHSLWDSCYQGSRQIKYASEGTKHTRVLYV